MINKKWAWRYMKMADLVATWSKDPDRQVGAIAVGNKGQILSQGYNGFPRDVKDDDRLNTRDKLKFMVHAEANLIYNTMYNGGNLFGVSVFISGLPPCLECAKSLIQVGVKDIYVQAQQLDNISQNWAENLERSRLLLLEAKVGFHYVDMK